MTSDVVQVLTEAVQQGKIPFGVVCATNSDRSFNIEYAAGPTSLSADDHTRDVKADAMFLLASQTKLLTSIAALQIIERGLIEIEDDVIPYLPDLAAQPIFSGYNDKDEAIVQPSKNPITLRHLLTHTSGCIYDAISPDLQRYRRSIGEEPGKGTTMARFAYPLMFEPGTEFHYGTSLDWAGRLIEVLTGQTLQEYMLENIWTPLGITTNDMTFFAERSETLVAEFPDVALRGADGKLTKYTGPSINAGAEDCFGGHGVCGRLTAYVKVLHSILADDEKLLSSTSAKMLFTSQIDDEVRNSLNAFMEGPTGAMFIRGDGERINLDWGIGNLIIPQGDVDRRKKGSISWGGLYNTFWLIDREADIALTFGTHVFPPNDAMVAQVISDVERAIYREAKVKF